MHDTVPSPSTGENRCSVVVPIMLRYGENERSMLLCGLVVWVSDIVEYKPCYGYI